MKRITLFLICMTAAVCGAQTSINSVLATVDGEPVTLCDVINETALAERRSAGEYTGERLSAKVEQLRREKLIEIVFRKLVYKEYLRNPFDIPSQNVEALLDRVAEDYGNLSREELEKRLKEHDMTLADLRAKMREHIAVEWVLQRDCDTRVQVSPKEVYDEYLASPDEWRTGEQIEFQMLQLSREGGHAGTGLQKTVELLIPQLKDAGQTRFAELAAQYSDGVKRDGALVTGVALEKLRPEFQTVLKGAKEGAIIGPVETPEAVFFLRINRIHPAAVKPFEEVSGMLQERIRQRKIREKREEYKQKLLSKALIKYYI